MRAKPAVILSQAAHPATQSNHPSISSGSAPPRALHSFRQFYRRRGWALSTLLFLIAILLVTHTAHAQGCAQCLDTTRATPPATQAAFRHAIELLGGVASALFIAGLILLRREP